MPATRHSALHVLPALLLLAGITTGCTSMIMGILYPTGDWPADRPLTVREGFAVERVYRVPREEQGSWVSLAVDDKGRLIASDQHGDLYRITPTPPGGPLEATRVERLDVDVGHAHGLLYAFDSLYVLVNRGFGGADESNGLYRLRDTDDDDQFDEVRRLRKLEGHNEHGMHQLVMAPDGESLFFIAGNETPPTEFAHSRVPRVWQEDQLLPVIPNRFILNLPPPGGWVAKLDPEGERWELYAMGLRNPYDLAFNRAGDLFTYDADMEWDIGAPWYRPTRVNHVMSGGEYGWRKGSAKWPEYYPDSLGAVADVGTGSPTGIAFGYGAAFPERYREALYLLDWSHGKVYAAQLEPDGASYTADLEPFLFGQPLPVTDMVINPADGAMYVTTGGRRAESSLYRVTYVGSEPVAQAAESKTHAVSEEAKLRNRLEALHSADAPNAIDEAWPHLSHADRAVRHAARVAIEHQPPARWRDRALRATETDTRIGGTLALARVGTQEDRDAALEALLELDPSSFTRRQRVDWLRAVSLWLIRHGRPAPRIERELVTQLEALFPAASFQENRELSELLVYLGAAEGVETTLALLEQAPTQEEQIHYAYALSHADTGWTLDQRRSYFAWLDEAESLPGGSALGYFVEKIADSARGRLSVGERLQLAVGGSPKPALSSAPFRQPEGPGRAWSVAELEPALASPLAARDFERGEAMFTAGACFSCHRFDGRGGANGPDLTSVGGRFRPIEIAESIAEPSAVVSNQYRAATIHMKDGSVVHGRVINQFGRIIEVSTNMMTSETQRIDPEDVEKIVPSDRSLMPPGLIDTMNESEVLDLLAYLVSGGDPEHPAFR